MAKHSSIGNYWWVFLIVVAGAIIYVMTQSQEKVEDLSTNPEKYIGEEVTITGVISGHYKSGQIESYKVESTQVYGEKVVIYTNTNLENGQTVGVTGIFGKDPEIGYYITASEVIVK